MLPPRRIPNHYHSVKFYAKKRRQPAIVILSLIDILAILLIFFIVTTTFRKNQPQLEINLPESKSASPSPDATQEPALLQVRSESEILLDGTPATIQNLASQLATWKSLHPNTPLALQADRDAPFGLIVKVLDALQSAGIQNIPAFAQDQEMIPQKP